MSGRTLRWAQLLLLLAVALAVCLPAVRASEGDAAADTDALIDSATEVADQLTADERAAAEAQDLLAGEAVTDSEQELFDNMEQALFGHVHHDSDTEAETEAMNEQDAEILAEAEEAEAAEGHVLVEASSEQGRGLGRMALSSNIPKQRAASSGANLHRGMALSNKISKKPLGGMLSSKALKALHLNIPKKGSKSAQKLALKLALNLGKAAAKSSKKRASVGKKAHAKKATKKHAKLAAKAGKKSRAHTKAAKRAAKKAAKKAGKKAKTLSKKAKAKAKKKAAKAKAKAKKKAAKAKAKAKRIAAKKAAAVSAFKKVEAAKAKAKAAAAEARAREKAALKLEHKKAAAFRKALKVRKTLDKIEGEKRKIAKALIAKKKATKKALRVAARRERRAKKEKAAKRKLAREQLRAMKESESVHKLKHDIRHLSHRAHQLHGRLAAAREGSHPISTHHVIEDGLGDGRLEDGFTRNVPRPDRQAQKAFDAAIGRVMPEAEQAAGNNIKQQYLDDAIPLLSQADEMRNKFQDFRIAMSQEKAAPAGWPEAVFEADVTDNAYY